MHGSGSLKNTCGKSVYLVCSGSLRPDNVSGMETAQPALSEASASFIFPLQAVHFFLNTLITVSGSLFGHKFSSFVLYSWHSLYLTISQTICFRHFVQQYMWMVA
ncbi:hypothetical protein CC79DRAFT_829137 [Sarocladium strictum]